MVLGVVVMAGGFGLAVCAAVVDDLPSCLSGFFAGVLAVAAVAMVVS